MSSAGGVTHAEHALLAGGGLWLTVGSIALGFLVVSAVLKLAGRYRSPEALAGALLIVAAACAAPFAAVMEYHVATMVLLEVVVVIGPLLLVGRQERIGPADDVYMPLRASLAFIACAAAAAIFVVCHLPVGHEQLMTGAPWWAVGVGTLTGCAAWAAVLRFRLTATTRTLAISALLETAMLVGVVMLWASTNASGPAAYDYRAAGVVMIVLDLVVLVRLMPNVVWPGLPLTLPREGRAPSTA
jgi:hypothetical protein